VKRGGRCGGFPVGGRFYREGRRIVRADLREVSTGSVPPLMSRARKPKFPPEIAEWARVTNRFDSWSEYRPRAGGCRRNRRPRALVVAIVGDVVLLSIFLLSDAAFNRFLRPRPDIRGSDFLGGAFSLGVKIGVIYLYGWISVRGGGDWTALA
jgi:hypothetical protein